MGVGTGTVLLYWYFLLRTCLLRGGPVFFFAHGPGLLFSHEFSSLIHDAFIEVPLVMVLLFGRDKLFKGELSSLERRKRFV